MAKHNATGRSITLPKTNPADKPKIESKVDEQTKAEIDAELSNSKQTPKEESVTNKPEAKLPALKVVDPSKGLATRNRWSACLKARPGAKLVMPSDVKLLALDSVIVTLQPGNPKKRSSATRYNWCYDGTKGYRTTIKAVVDKYEKKTKGSTLAYADIAWDVNHGFIEVEAAASAPEPIDIVAEVKEIVGEENFNELVDELAEKRTEAA